MVTPSMPDASSAVATLERIACPIAARLAQISVLSCASSTAEAAASATLSPARVEGVHGRRAAFAGESRGDPRAARRFHYVAPTDDRRERESIRQCLAEDSEVWRDARQRLVAAGSEAEARLHLVEDEHGA